MGFQPRRARARLTLAASLLWLLPACLHCPTDEDWLGIGHRSPQQTFLTFRTALATDALDLEYRCWSSDFLRREGVTQLLYREFREQLMDEQPFLRKAAEAVVLDERRYGTDRALLVAEVATWVKTVTFSVVLVREDFYELWSEDRRATDGFRSFEELVRVSEDGQWMLGGAPLEAEFDASTVTELRLGREWKIDSITVLDDASAPVP